MNVLFDSHIFSLQRFGGISRYFIEIACELNKINNINANIFAPLHISEMLHDSSAKHFGLYAPKLRAGVRKRIDRVSSQLWESFAPHDILHTTYYLRHHPSKRKAPIVVTVHDMIHELMPESFRKDDPTAKMKLSAINVADHVICVSESTRQDLLALYPLDPLKTTVIHHGVKPPERLQEDSSRSVCNGRYLLYVGQRGGYKNFTLLLEAYASSKTLQDDFRIIAFGGGSFTDSEKTLIQKLALKEDAVTHCHGDDNRLAVLYRQAAAFVYPSLYEGFGMPVLEAMAYGCPVFASNCSSIPEAGGTAAEYFDPTQVDSLVYALENTLYSNEKRTRLIETGFRRAADFSWSKTAHATSNVYRQVLGK